MPLLSGLVGIYRITSAGSRSSCWVISRTVSSRWVCTYKPRGILATVRGTRDSHRLDRDNLKTLGSDNAPTDLRAMFLGLHATFTGVRLLPASLFAGFLWDPLGAQAPSTSVAAWVSLPHSHPSAWFDLRKETTASNSTVKRDDLFDAPINLTIIEPTQSHTR